MIKKIAIALMTTTMVVSAADFQKGFGENCDQTTPGNLSATSEILTEKLSGELETLGLSTKSPQKPFPENESNTGFSTLAGIADATSNIDAVKPLEVLQNQDESIAAGILQEIVQKTDAQIVIDYLNNYIEIAAQKKKMDAQFVVLHRIDDLLEIKNNS